MEGFGDWGENRDKRGGIGERSSLPSSPLLSSLSVLRKKKFKCDQKKIQTIFLMSETIDRWF
jgi:hypothetical protein